MPASLSTNEILSFRVSQSLTGAATASIVVDNLNEEFSPHKNDVRGNTITLSLSRGLLTRTVFKGRVKRVTPTYDERGRMVAVLDLASITESLQSRPVTTETLEMDGGDLMEYLLTVYGGLDASFIDSPLEDNGESFEKVTVSENSIIAGVRKIADACNVEIFVNRFGRIATELKRINTEAADVTLHHQEIEGSLQEQLQEVLLPSVCRVRGRSFFEQEDGGVMALGSQDFAVMPRSETRAVVKIPVDEPISLQQAQGSEVIVAGSGAVSGQVIDFKDGELIVEIRGSWDAGETQTFTIEVEVPQDIRVHSMASTLQETVGPGTDATMDTEATMDRIKVEPVVFKKNNRDKQISQHRDEPTLSRIEAIASHDPTITAVGVRYMEIDNMYIQDEPIAIEIGESALLERRMAAHTFRFTGSWLPSIVDVNSIIDLQLSTTGEIVKCLLAAITTTFESATGKASSMYDLVKMVD